MNLINDDCMNIMPDYADDYFDLAIVDVPYGISDLTGLETSNHRGMNKTRVFGTLSDKFKEWDKAPTKEYFDELFRVSKNQIIWGGNYFDLPPYRCVVVWDKCQPISKFSAVEIAWTSFNKPASMYKYDNRTGGKIHPTQKPRQLYSWLLETYAEPSDKVLDTHLGSGSIAIACHYFGIKEFVGIEIDKEYFDNAKTRIEKETRQIKLL